MNRLTSRTLGHRICVPSHDGATQPRLARGTALALLALALAACGRGGDASGESIGKAEGAVVTGTTPVLTISSGTSNFTANGGAILVDPNVTLTISDGSDLAGAQVSISTGYVNGQDVLACTASGGVTCSWASGTGILTLTGTASVPTYQTVLRSVTYNNMAGSSPNTQARAVTFNIGSTSLSFGGHYYEFVNTSLTWANAKTAAAARSFYGLQGYLATVTSASENAFINAKLAADGWIGASDSAAEGQWRWVTGPEGLANGGVGTLFSTGQSPNVVTVSGSYSNWRSGEPNNCCAGGENWAEFYATGGWNDLGSTSSLPYVVEYGGMPNETTPQVSGAKSMTVSSLPNYNITASAGANGTISPTGVTSLQQGQSQTFTITPTTNYAVASVLVDGVSVGAVSTYTFTNVMAAHTISVTFSPPTIAVSAGNNQTTATGAAFGTGLAALVTDSGGTPLSGVTVLFTAPGSGASATVTGSATTGASGLATASATANATAGGYNVTATISGTAVATTFALRNVGAPSTITVVSGSNQSAVVQGAFAAPLVAVVKDASAYALPNVTVTFAAPSAGVASAALSATSVSTDSSGQASVTATASTIAGIYNVTASAPSVGSASFALTNTAGAAAAITLSSGGTQSATIGTAFGAPIVARVTDAFANPTAGATVTFAAPASGASGTLATPAPATNALGLAQTTVTANTTAGSYGVSASIALAGGGTASVSATLTNNAGAPATLTITGGNGQIALTGAAFASPLSVRVADGSGNPVGGATVAFTAIAASGSGASATLSTATAATNASGIATVLATANTHAGNYTVTANSGGAPAASFTLTNQNLLALSPSGASVAPRGSVTFVASGGSSAGYVFAVQTAPSGGTINPMTGVYTAGSTPLVTDVITVTDSQSHTASASISVGAALALTSNPTHVPPRGGALFTTTGGSQTGLAFTIVTNHSNGTIDSTGHYVAGQNDSVTDLVSVTDSLGNTATASIDVSAGATLTASGTSTPPRGALSFAAAGGSGTFTYALGANPSGGTINPTTGAYTAGSAFDVTDVVTATDTLGNTASVNVAVGHGVTVSPASPSVPPLGTITLSASGGSGTGYTFTLGSSASGVIADAASGVYVAGGAPNASDLVTVTDSLGNTGTTSISIGGGIRVSPSSLTTPPLGSQAFTVSGGSGSGYMFSLTSHASGGMIDGSTGGYTAGATGATMDELLVVDSLGNHASVIITVGPGVALSPATATLAPLGHQTVNVSGGSGSGYTFTLSTNHSGGHVDSLTGEYTAGGVGGVTDVITAHDDLGNTATATLMVTPALSVAAATVSAAPRASLSIVAMGGAPAYAYSISSNGSGGLIDPATGAYTAGSNPDSTDVITITDHNLAVTNVIVNVGAGVAIVPAHPSVPPRGAIAFGGVNGSGTGYTFALTDNKSGGTIVAATGAYTAGPTGDVADLVTLTDSLGNTTSVSVAVGGHLVLGPESASVAPRESLALFAVAGSGTGYVYAFTTNASGATLDASTGAYVAGVTPNVADVLMVTDSLGNTASATVTIGPGLSVVPPAASTPPKGTVSLTTSGGSAIGYHFAVTTNASSGSVSASGVYTAGAVGDTVDVVTVTDSLGNTDTVTITVGHGLTVTSTAGLVPPRGTATFTAAGGVGGGYTFTVRSNGSGGNIVSSTGVYTSGDNASSTDVIEVTDPFGNVVTLPILVGPAVTITPASLSTAPRGTLTLVAAGGSGTGYRYALTTNASGGTLDATTGLYTAGSTTDVIDAVQVVDSLGNMASATIAIGGALTVNGTVPTVAPRESVLLTAAGGSGMGFTFVITTNASGGTIDPVTGRYTAGSTGNVQDLVTVTDSLGNMTQITLQLGDVVHITPDTVQAAPLAQMTFAVSGGSGEGYVFSLTGNDSHGTVDPATGAYTAGALGGGTDVVTVMDSLGNTATVTIHVGMALSATVPTVTAPPHGTVTVAVTGGTTMLTYTLSTNGSGGSINPTTGAYTAGPMGGTTDVITVRDANGATVTITVHIGPGVTVAPVTGPVQTGQTMALSASGGSGSGQQWTIVSAGSGGTVDPATGAYTAGPHAGTDVIRVVDSLGNSAQLSIPVTLVNASHPVNLQGGGCTCAMAAPGAPGGGVGGLGGRAAALTLGACGLVLVARRRRRRAPTEPRGKMSGGGSRSARVLRSLFLGGILVLLATSTARAQSAGFALDQFNPSQRGSDWFVLDSLDIHGNLRPAVGVSSSWAYRPLVLTSPDGSYKMSVMTNQAITHVGGSLVMWSRVRFGVDIPVQIFGDGNNTTVDGVNYQGPANHSSLGDIRLNATVRVFGERRGPLTGALALTGFLPTGDTASYAGDGGAGVAPSALLAGQAGLFAYAAQVGGTVRRRTVFADTSVGSDLFLSAAAGVRLAHDRLLIGPELFGRSVLVGGAFLESRATPVEAMLGAHLAILSDWRASAGIATGLNGGIGSPSLRGLVALEWAPGFHAPDRDSDGIADATDACPDIAGIAASDARANGCPPPPLAPPAPRDRDRDGIADATDACPDVAGVSASDPKANGCPPPPPDRDGDTIADAVDACPDVAGVTASDPKANGCPLPPPDRDGDTIADAFDACPDVAGIASAEPATNGCPDPDRDHDGVANAEDACPDDAGPRSPDAKRSGCPKAFVSAGQIKILDQVKFRSGSATILSRGRDNQASEEALMAVRQILIDHADVKSVRVEGHTDNVGKAADNRRLSANRASAVVKWLVAHGVAADRLSSAGVGPDQPTAANNTAAGRRDNRRVEFHIVAPEAEDSHASAP